MSKQIDVYVGSRALGARKSEAGDEHIVAHASARRAQRRHAEYVEQLHPALLIPVKHHPNAHFKNRHNFVVGSILPEAEPPKKRVFHAFKKWQKANGAIRLWGYAVVDGHKRYGWVELDHLQYEKRKHTSEPAPSYDAHFAYPMVREIARSWRYTSEAKHKIPVHATLVTKAKRVALYPNPVARHRRGYAEPRDGRLKMSIRYARKAKHGGYWLLCCTGGEDWIFIKLKKLSDLRVNEGFRGKKAYRLDIVRNYPYAWA